MSFSSHLDSNTNAQDTNTISVIGRQWSPIIIVLIASGLSVLAGWIAIGISQNYYATAPYHYDAAVYMLRGADLAHLLHTDGFIAALRLAISSKDSLDLTLRLLVASSTLEQRYGHLAVLLPLMALFIGLLCWYLITRARSWLIAIAISASLMAFPLLYDPFWGISSNWKDNLATWLLASTVLAWLLACNMSHIHWSIVSSTLLGLLVAQRSAVAVYAAILFAPPFLWALIHQIRTVSLWRAMRLAAAFVLPATLLGGMVLVWQWRGLYEYYFVYGYAYGTPAKVARYLANGFGFRRVDPEVGFFVGIPYGIGYAPAVLLGMAVPALVGAMALRRRITDSIVAAWFLVGLPVIIIGTSTMFHGFFAIWSPLLVIMLSTLYADLGTFDYQRWVASVVLIVALLAAVAQYRISGTQYNQFATERAHLRQFYATVGELLKADTPSPQYAIVSGRSLSMTDLPLLRDQIIFDVGSYLPPAIFQAQLQDTIYHRFFPGKSEQQLISQAIAAIQTTEGTLAVSECDPTQVSLALPPQQVLSRGVVTSLNSYVLNSPQWQMLAQVSLPVRCVMIARYTGHRLTQTEKWGSLVQYRILVKPPTPAAKP